LARDFATKENANFGGHCRIGAFSPPASSEANPKLANRASWVRIRKSGGIETMKIKLFRVALLSVSLLTLFGTAAAQRHGHIDKGERRELRADRREVRADTREIRGDRRDIRGDARERRSDVREYRQDRREGASQEELRADRQEIKGDTREIRNDRRDIRIDVRDRRGDARDYRRDRREARRD
jgi:hypothetical protein